MYRSFSLCRVDWCASRMYQLQGLSKTFYQKNYRQFVFDVFGCFEVNSSEIQTSGNPLTIYRKLRNPLV